VLRVEGGGGVVHLEWGRAVGRGGRGAEVGGDRPEAVAGDAPLDVEGRS